MRKSNTDIALDNLELTLSSIAEKALNARSELNIRLVTPEEPAEGSLVHQFKRAFYDSLLSAIKEVQDWSEIVRPRTKIIAFHNATENEANWWAYFDALALAIGHVLWFEQQVAPNEPSDIDPRMLAIADKEAERHNSMFPYREEAKRIPEYLIS